MYDVLCVCLREGRLAVVLCEAFSLIPGCDVSGGGLNVILGTASGA